jgi:hypothetical protein
MDISNLTVKNPHVTDLRSTIQEMNKGWKRLIQTSVSAMLLMDLSEQLK